MIYFYNIYKTCIYWNCVFIYEGVNIVNFQPLVNIKYCSFTLYSPQVSDLKPISDV